MPLLQCDDASLKKNPRKSFAGKLPVPRQRCLAHAFLVMAFFFFKAPLSITMQTTVSTASTAHRAQAASFHHGVMTSRRSAEDQPFMALELTTVYRILWVASRIWVTM